MSYTLVPRQTDYFRLFTGQRLAFPRDDAVIRFLREGWFEYSELAAFTRILRPGDQFVDIGAHCGLYSAIASYVLGENGNVIAVEPNTDIHPFLISNLRPHWIAKGCSKKQTGRGLITAAMGDKNGEVILHIPDGGKSAYASLISGSRNKRVPVTTIALQSLLEKIDDRVFTFIKMDVEGMEFDILRPAIPCLRARKNIHFQIEFDEHNANLADHTSQGLADLLQNDGYELYLFDIKSERITPYTSGFPVWNTNLIITRDPDCIAERLETVDPNIREITNDLLHLGEVCQLAYLKSEKFNGIKSELVTTAETVLKMHAQLECRPLTDEVDQLRLTLEQADNTNLASIVHDQLGKLNGAAQSVAEQLALANQGLVAVHADLLKVKPDETFIERDVFDPLTLQQDICAKVADIAHDLVNARLENEKMQNEITQYNSEKDIASVDLNQALLEIKKTKTQLDRSRARAKHASTELRKLKEEHESEILQSERSQEETENLKKQLERVRADSEIVRTDISERADEARDIIASILFGKDRPQEPELSRLHAIKTQLTAIRSNSLAMLGATSHDRRGDNEPHIEEDIDLQRRMIRELKEQFQTFMMLVSEIEQSRWMVLGDHLGVAAAERVKKLSEFLDRVSKSTDTAKIEKLNSLLEPTRSTNAPRSH